MSFVETVAAMPPRTLVYKIVGCTVVLPDVTRKTASGVSETLSGLAVPALHDLAAKKIIRSTAQLELTRRGRSVRLPVAVIARYSGRERLTVPAGSYDTQRIAIEATVRSGAHVLTEHLRYWFDPAVGTVRADVSADADGRGSPTETSVLIKRVDGKP